MKKSSARIALVLAAILGVACLGGISHAGDLSGAQQGFRFENTLVAARNFDASMLMTASRSAGSDGAACSSDDECSSKVCEGGSCCTDYGASCDSSSHCCGHQSCINGACPN